MVATDGCFTNAACVLVKASDAPPSVDIFKKFLLCIMKIYFVTGNTGMLFFILDEDCASIYN